MWTCISKHHVVTLNLHNVTCQLYSNKAGENLTNHICTCKCVAYHSECFLLHMKEGPSPDCWALKPTNPIRVSSAWFQTRWQRCRQVEVHPNSSNGTEDHTLGQRPFCCTPVRTNRCGQFWKRRETQTSIGVFTSLLEGSRPVCHKEDISLYSISPPLITGKWDRALGTKQALN